MVDAQDTIALEQAVASEERRSRLRFSELGIAIGSVLAFAKDETIACVVVADGKVNFENETMSPSMAAKLAVKRLGYNWSAVSGSDFWKYEDETLSARRLRFEEKPES